MQVVDRRDVSAPSPDYTVTNAFMFQKSNVLRMIKSKEIPIKPQNLLTIRWCRVIFGLAGHVCVSYQVTSACRDKMQHVLRNFFFLHGKMASLTVQDVEVRAPKMICKKSYCAFAGILLYKRFPSSAAREALINWF